jgi:hypothetical protein
MLQTGSPKPLWDHSLELEALVHSCTSNNIYMTAGQVPETIMTGNTADISHIAEFALSDWVMFQDKVPGYPNNKMTLGRYLGPATDMGSALTSKILAGNVSVVLGIFSPQIDRHADMLLGVLAPTCRRH